MGARKNYKPFAQIMKRIHRTKNSPQTSPSNGNSGISASPHARQACLVCVLKYLIYIGKYFGISPLSWACPHSKYPQKPEFQICKIAYGISCIISFMLICTVFYNIYDIFNYDFAMQKLRVIYVFNDTIHITIAGLCTFISLLQIKHKIREFTGILKILENKEMYGVTKMFSYKRVRRIFIAGNILCIVAILLTITQLFWDVGRNIDAGTSWISIYQSIMASLAMFITIVILLQFIASCYIYNILFQELHDNLKDILNPYRKPISPGEYVHGNNDKHWDVIEFKSNTFLNRNEFAKDKLQAKQNILKRNLSPTNINNVYSPAYNNNTTIELKNLIKPVGQLFKEKPRESRSTVKKFHINEMLENTSTENSSNEQQRPTTLRKPFVSLSVQLSKLRRLYASFIFNIKVLNDFYDPTKLILVSLVLISMVINIYLIIMTHIEESLDAGMNVQSAVKLVGSLSATIFFFETADRIRISAQNISLYLYSFPISGLGSQEAGEIEMYLEMLNTQKPLLSASGVFNISTGLLASISGTVVTYVLVALQFKIVWQESTNSTLTTLDPN